MQEIEGKVLLTVFRDIPDPRSARGIRHKLEDIVVISVLAFICDANDYVDIREWGVANEEWLRTFLSLKHGIPSVDTFERVFCILKPEVWQSRFRQWTRETVLAENDNKHDEVIAVDGKTARGSHTEGLNALHTVSLWSSYGGIVLAQEDVPDKTNEITVIPDLLSVVNPAGAVVTSDAMGTQKDIAWTIREFDADYLLALKDNHPTLFEDVQWLFEQGDQDNWHNTAHSYTKTLERSRDRLEQRECWVLDELDFLEQAGHWRDLRSIVRVRSSRTHQETCRVHDRFYISSLAADAERVLYAARTHWGIENSLHWVLDVVFDEDASRARKDNAQANLVSLRHTALNILKQDTNSKSSIKAKRKRAGWNRDYLLELICLL